MTTDEANAIRMDLSTEQCGLTHMFVYRFVSLKSLILFSVKCQLSFLLYFVDFQSLYDKRSLTETQDMKVRMDDSCWMMFSFDIG